MQNKGEDQEDKVILVKIKLKRVARKTNIFKVLTRKLHIIFRLEKSAQVMV